MATKRNHPRPAKPAEAAVAPVADRKKALAALDKVRARDADLLKRLAR